MAHSQPVPQPPQSPAAGGCLWCTAALPVMAAKPRRGLCRQHRAWAPDKGRPGEAKHIHASLAWPCHASPLEVSPCRPAEGLCCGPCVLGGQSPALRGRPRREVAATDNVVYKAPPGTMRPGIRASQWLAARHGAIIRQLGGPGRASEAPHRPPAATPEKYSISAPSMDRWAEQHAGGLEQGTLQNLEALTKRGGRCFGAARI